MENDFSGENNRSFETPEDEEQLRIARDGGGLGRDNSERRQPPLREEKGSSRGKSQKGSKSQGDKGKR